MSSIRSLHDPYVRLANCEVRMWVDWSMPPRSVEAPILTADGRTLYYHKRNGKRVRICRLGKKKSKKRAFENRPARRDLANRALRQVRHLTKTAVLGAV